MDIRIGIIGAGGIGKAFARQVAKAGYEVLISNSRGPASLAETVAEIGGNTKAVSVADAIKADVIFLAVRWPHAEEVLSANKIPSGKILIDAMNPMASDTAPAELHGMTSSTIIQDKIPHVKVVKAFNTLSTVLLASDPNVGGGKRVLFFCGNDADAKETVSGIIRQTGFAGVDLGTLAEGSRLQQYPGGTVPGLNLISLA